MHQPKKQNKGSLKEQATDHSIESLDGTDIDVSPKKPRSALGPGHAAPEGDVKPKRVRKVVAEHKRTIGAEIRNMKEPIRRLIISKVVLRNFKSYGGTTVIGPFHKRFTSVVGPNGSGKSNVIDAMLFVFGFRAKQMRFEKLAELIHNSNAYVRLNNGQPLESMDVSVHFCEILDSNPDIDDYEVIPNSELIITREVFKDSSSKYKINGSVSTQKQVSNSLKSYGMDLYNNRFLILQGEVEQISQMKPKATKPEEEGLLEYLEDIIGTNQYLEKIKEAQVEYEKHQEEYQGRCNRTRAAQKEVEDLLDSKKEADEYCAKEKTMYENMILLAQREIARITKDRDKVTSDLKELKESIKNENAKMDKVQAEKKEASDKLKKAETNLEKATKEQRHCQEALQKMCSKDEDLRKQLLREVKKVEEKTKSIKKANESKPEHEKASKEKLDRAESLVKTIPQIQEELDAAEVALDKMTETLKPEMDAAQKKLAECESKLAPIQQSYDAVDKEISILESSIKLIENRRKEAETTLKRLKENEAQVRKVINSNKSALQEKNKELESQEKELSKNMATIEELVNAITTGTQDGMKRKGEYESMKREFQELAGSNDQYKHIMSMAASGKLKGVHGRLGDLGSTLPEHETAFMAAGGAHVDVIVVETPEIASVIFDELRKKNLGRCSAVALSALNNDLRRRMEAAEATPLQGLPPGTQKLIDLIHPTEPKYKVCFYHAIRDTLLAKSLADASVIGYQHRKRVVTMEGELIEPDGRMSGGGLNKKPGGSLKKKDDGKTPGSGVPKFVDAKELENFKKQLDKDLAQIEKQQSQLNKLNQHQFTLEKGINDLKHKIHVLTQSLENDQLQLNEQVQRIRELSAAGADSVEANKDEEAQLKELQANLTAKTKEKKSIQEKVQLQEKLVAEAYKVRENVGKGKLKAAKAKVCKAEQNLTNVRKEVDKLRKDAAGLQADAEKCSRDVKKFEKEIEQHKKREKELEKQLDNLEEEASKANEQLITANKNLQECQSVLNGLTELIAEKNRVIEEHSLKSVEKKHKLDDITNKLEEMEKAVASHNEGMRDLKSKLENTVALIKKSADADVLLVLASKPIVTKPKSKPTLGAEKIDINSDDDDVQEIGFVEKAPEPKENAQTEEKDKGQKKPKGKSKGKKTKGGEEEEDEDGKEGTVNGATSAKSTTSEETVGSARKKRDKGESKNEDDPIDVDKLKKEIAQLKKDTENIPNLGVIDTFTEKVSDYKAKRTELERVQLLRDQAKSIFDELSLKRKTEFLSNFAIIASKLKQMYQTITFGGDAELELADSTDPFTEGILFSVRPAKKSWKQIQNLSGGEKTLSSLALVFALHHYKPNPVYFMDEIDAALDFRNVSIIAQNIKERTKDAQFIIISLRNQMFELCNQMVGIYKTLDVTKSVCINPSTFNVGKRLLKEEDGESLVRA